MTSIYSIFLLFLIGCHVPYAQYGFKIEKSQELFEKDWSNLEHLLPLGKKNKHNEMAPYELQEAARTAIAQIKERRLNRRGNEYAEMPIYAPEGNHSMPIHFPDSTIRYHLRIDKLK